MDIDAVWQGESGKLRVVVTIVRFEVLNERLMAIAIRVKDGGIFMAPAKEFRVTDRFYRKP